LIQELALGFVIYYGYLAIFVLLMLGIVGLPIPDELLMMYVGSLVSSGHLGYTATVTISLLGSLSGMFFSFYIGKRFGLSFLERFGSYVRLTPQKIEKANSWFCRYGRWAIMLGYFIPGVRNLTAYLAGINSWRFGTFALYALPGAVVWVMLFVTLGYTLGNSWELVYEGIREYLLLILALVLACILAFWRLSKYQADKEN